MIQGHRESLKGWAPRTDHGVEAFCQECVDRLGTARLSNIENSVYEIANKVDHHTAADQDFADIDADNEQIRRGRQALRLAPAQLRRQYARALHKLRAKRSRKRAARKLNKMKLQTDAPCPVFRHFEIGGALSQDRTEWLEDACRFGKSALEMKAMTKKSSRQGCIVFVNCIRRMSMRDLI